jgi:hypothetical protein
LVTFTHPLEATSRVPIPIVCDCELGGESTAPFFTVRSIVPWDSVPRIEFVPACPPLSITTWPNDWLLSFV